jgi:hypothetical protein
MDSVAATNATGTATLIQLLSNSGSPLRAAGMSAAQVQSALKDASPADIVQISDQALQQQLANGLFGNPDTSQTDGLFAAASSSSSSTTLDNLLTSLSATPGSAATSGSQTASVSSQIAQYQSELQSEQAQALLGVGATSGVSGTSLNVLG